MSVAVELAAGMGTGGQTDPGTRSVLVVDDEPEMADLVATYLERVDDSMAVTDVTDPRDALDRVRRRQFDAVVSDYHMPPMDGLTFLETVGDVAPGAVRILYTSDDADALVREAREVDVTYVHKRMRRERYERIANYIHRHSGPNES